jgi:hypothetical protein
MPEERSDAVTVAAIAIVAYALANVLHEGVGHGGACLLIGGRPIALSSVHFECEEGSRFVSAAGTIVNFIAAGISYLLMKRAPGRYFLWLFTTINLLMAAGYFLFSGIGNIGDWAAVFRDTAPPIVWRPILAIIGGALYYFFARRAAIWAQPFADAKRLMMISYFTGGLLYCISGAFNPHGPLLIAISAAAASFGGTSGLMWMDSFVPAGGERVVRRSVAWIVAGVITAAVFIGVLGPSLSFRA